MTTQEIAARVTVLNRTGDHEKVYEEFYTPETVSVETWEGKSTEYVGMDAITAKAAEWAANLVEMHEVRVSEPLVADSSFALTFFMDCTYKDRGRTTMTEMAVYTVRDGKIVREEFQA